MRQAINTAHPPRLHFSQAIKTEQFIFVAGTGGHHDPHSGEERKGIVAQTKQCLDTMKEVLETSGASLSDIVTVTAYVRNLDDFPDFNETYKTYFPKDPPARATLITGFVRPDMLVEIQCIALRPSSK